jgi:DNA-binding protein YbaB
MSNDGLRHQMTEVLALVQEQMADIAAVQRKQAELTATAVAADGLVEVTVNARGHVVKTVIDEDYLDEYEFEELADHITEAAQAAAQKAAQRVSQMMAPISERRKALPSLSQFVEGAPDLRDLTRAVFEHVPEDRSRRDPGEGGGDESVFPTVRR